MLQPAFVRNENGQYQVLREVSKQDIIDTATALLWNEIVDNDTLSSPTKVANYLRLQLAEQPNEQFCVLFLNNQHQPIKFERLFQGTIDTAAVYPRVIVQRALALNAAAVVFAHNHPSGDFQPSSADRAITERLVKALDLVDIRVLDHFIVSSAGHYSFCEAGLL